MIHQYSGNATQAKQPIDEDELAEIIEREREEKRKAALKAKDRERRKKEKERKLRNRWMQLGQQLCDEMKINPLKEKGSDILENFLRLYRAIAVSLAPKWALMNLERL
jgi:hypothetical protein